MDDVLGIDLGTTNTVGAWIGTDGKVQVVPIGAKGKVLPSVVWYGGQGEHRMVGALAREQIVEDATHTVFGFKRFLGRAFHAPFVQENKRRFLYPLVSGDDAGCAVDVYERKRPLVEVASTVIEALLEHATRARGAPFTACVLTVPAHFGYSQREAVREAAQRAGLRVVSMVNEPTAAAMFYAQRRQQEGCVLVFDLGGGTFDATLLQIGERVEGGGRRVRVLGTGGDAFLGGADFDAAIVDGLAEKFRQARGVDVRANRVVVQRLHMAAEKAKVTLSKKESARIRVPFVAMHDDAMLDFDFTLTRGQLDAMCAPLIERCVSICQGLLRVAGVDAAALDDIVLVGGQTRMPAIQRRLEVSLGQPPSSEVHPELGVAVGAAMLGRGLGELVDVVPAPLTVMSPTAGVREVLSAHGSLPATGRVPLPRRPPAGEPLVFSLAEQIDSEAQEELGVCGAPGAWLDAHPGPLALEVVMGRDYRLSVAVCAGDDRLPLELRVTPRVRAPRR